MTAAAAKRRRAPKRGDLVVYRWGTGGVPVLAIVLRVEGRRVFYGCRVGDMNLESLGGATQGPKRDGIGAEGTWRWPHAGEVEKDEAGRWRFARAPSARAKEE